MSELLHLVRRLVGFAEGGEDLEAFATHERSFYVKAYAGEVEAMSSSEPRGAGVRIVDRGRSGYAYTTDLSEGGLADLVRRARDNARHATPDDAVALPQSDGAVDDVEGLVDPAQAELPAETKVALALELERLTRAADPLVRQVEEAVYSDSITEIGLASTRGVEGSYTRSDAWCYTLAIADDGNDVEVGFEFDLARGLASLDPGQVARRAAARAVQVLGASKVRSARMPVVFEPYVAGQFLSVLGRALTGEAVQKGRSLLAGRLGDAVAATRLTLVDDGRLPGAPGSAPWDAEGVPTQRTEVIRDGTLRSFLYDTVSGRREGRASTGNAQRASFKGPPGPGPTNLAFDPTGESRDDVLRRAGKALLVETFHGVHSGTNPVSGDFSVGVTGRLLDDGAPARPVKEVTIALPMLDILASIVAVADDRRWLPFGGSYGGATVLVSEMTVGGK